MEKYGVDTESEAAKVAAAKDDPRCPQCASPLSKTANVPTCPKCGTEPFESKA